nr:MAG TPA: hypothetical protein [Caudoviricetes sp.]
MTNLRIRIIIITSNLKNRFGNKKPAPSIKHFEEKSG